MTYLYYPGCSLEGTANEYHVSTVAVMTALGAELTELENWTCCGASASEPISYLLSLTLPAINLAIAEKMEGTKEILTPCSACYLNLKKVKEIAYGNSGLMKRINQALAEKELTLKGQASPRHLLDVLVRDIGEHGIRSRVTKSLQGLRVAPYYGCQCLRPYAVFDDPEKPRSMEPLIKATGASVHAWNMGGKCCGASNMTTKKQEALELVKAILEQAKGAHVIVTVCPMCQMNVEAYQSEASSASGKDLRIPVLYLPQLLGLAFGLPEEQLKLKMNLSINRDNFKFLTE